MQTLDQPDDVINNKSSKVALHLTKLTASHEILITNTHQETENSTKIPFR